MSDNTKPLLVAIEQAIVDLSIHPAGCEDWKWYETLCLEVAERLDDAVVKWRKEETLVGIRDALLGFHLPSIPSEDQLTVLCDILCQIKATDRHVSVAFNGTMHNVVLSREEPAGGKR